MNTPLLWHIPLSHYSEKVRWALDYKGIAHRRRVLGPTLIRVWRATGQGKLPVLWLDGRAVTDSTRIIAALEEHYPEPPLYPLDTVMRQRALALEDDLDEMARRCAAIVTPLFRHDPDIALRVLTTGMGGRAYRTLRPLLRIFPSLYRFRHSISDNNLERDRVIVSAALGRIEHERQNRAYLVGETFTSQTSRLPRCWVRSSSLTRFSTH
jgi:glutathione S-transferase